MVVVGKELTQARGNRRQTVRKAEISPLSPPCGRLVEGGLAYDDQHSPEGEGSNGCYRV